MDSNDEGHRFKIAKPTEQFELTNGDNNNNVTSYIFICIYITI